jgi:HK97 family phage portal protein
VYACVRLISDTISTLPLDQFIRQDGQRVPFRPRDGWVDRPSLTMPRNTFWQQVIVSLLLDGNAFVYVMRLDSGDIAELQVLNPQKVHVLPGGFRHDDGRMFYP